MAESQLDLHTVQAVSLEAAEAGHHEPRRAAASQEIGHSLVNQATLIKMGQKASELFGEARRAVE